MSPSVGLNADPVARRAADEAFILILPRFINPLNRRKLPGNTPAAEPHGAGVLRDSGRQGERGEPRGCAAVARMIVSFTADTMMLLMIKR